MNKHATTENLTSEDSSNRSFFLKFLIRLFAIKGISFFDIFSYSNTYQEKLPIIYANIRV